MLSFRERDGVDEQFLERAVVCKYVLLPRMALPFEVMEALLLGNFVELRREFGVWLTGDELFQQDAVRLYEGSFENCVPPLSHDLANAHPIRATWYTGRSRGLASRGRSVRSEIEVLDGLGELIHLRAAPTAAKVVTMSRFVPLVVGGRTVGGLIVR